MFVRGQMKENVNSAEKAGTFPNGQLYHKTGTIYGPNLVNRANIWSMILQQCYYWSDFCRRIMECPKVQISHNLSKGPIRAFDRMNQTQYYRANPTTEISGICQHMLGISVTLIEAIFINIASIKCIQMYTMYQMYT